MAKARKGEPVEDAVFVDPALCVLPPTVRDVLHRPDQAAEALTLLEPGGESVSALMSLHPARLSDCGLIDALIASERQLATIAARQQQLLAETARRDPDGERFLREDVACALKLAPVTTGQKIDTAVALTSRLWDTFAQLEHGHLSLTHGRILANAVEHLDDGITTKVQARVLPRAAGQTPGEFRAAVRRAVARFDKRDAAERHKEAFADRRVICYPDEDAMATVLLNLAADGAAIVMAAVDAWASKAGRDDDRTADQRRADAIVEIAQAALAMPGLPLQHDLRPTVNITVPFSTLIGLDDAPGELEGYGPVPADMARRLASDPTGTWQRIITDTAGRVLDYGTCTYKPPAALAKHVITRDQRCVHPGCRRKAIACDLDHRVPFPYGATNSDNIEPLCQRHHVMKHHSNWTVTKRTGPTSGPAQPDTDTDTDRQSCRHQQRRTNHHRSFWTTIRRRSDPARPERRTRRCCPGSCRCWRRRVRRR